MTTRASNGCQAVMFLFVSGQFLWYTLGQNEGSNIYLLSATGLGSK